MGTQPLTEEEKRKRAALRGLDLAQARIDRLTAQLAEAEAAAAEAVVAAMEARVRKGAIRSALGGMTRQTFVNRYRAVLVERIGPDALRTR